MSTLKNIFDSLARLYDSTFNEWLYIHFVLRTFILLLCVWAFIYIAAQVFRYLLGPLLALFFYHVILRAWNFLFVETLMEWIYIHFYSRDKDFLSGTYLRLCDKVKRNRMRISHTRYKGILLNGGMKKTSVRLMAVGLIAASLWVVAFGLYRDYGRPVSAAPVPTVTPMSEPAPTLTPTTEPTPMFTLLPTAPPEPVDMFWIECDYLYLNEYGVPGANVRDKPDGENSTIIEIIWGSAELQYLDEFYEDVQIPSMYWLKIRTESGTEGYISNRLVQSEPDPGY